MEVYIGTIQPFAFQFAPRGWMLCSGQLLAIASNPTLYTLLGTTYGGDGVTTFALPNLNGRTILGQGASTAGGGFDMGQQAGSESITLFSSQMPMHTHGLMASTAQATTSEPGSNVVLATATGSDPTSGDAVTVHIYSPGPAATSMAPQSINVAGGNQPFGIMQPYLVVNYSIAAYGIFPSRN